MKNDAELEELFSLLASNIGALTNPSKHAKTQRSTLKIDFVCNRDNERIYIQPAYSLPDEEKQKQEQRSLTLTDDSFTKMILTTDNIPTHTLNNGIVMMNVFDFLLE